MRRLVEETLAGLERTEASFYRSPWSTGLWLAYSVAWIVLEARRGKAIGFDGYATILGVAIALATIRRLPPIRVKKLFRRR